MPSRRHVLALLAGSVAGCSKPVLSIPAIEEQPCPPIEVHAQRSVCSHTDAADGLRITVSPDTVSTDQESLEVVSVRIENGTDESVEYDPSGWRVYRNDGWGWEEREEPSGPRSDTDTDTIEPGKSAGWHGVDAMWDLGATGPTPAGLYAAINTVSAGAELVACIALFRVVRE